MLSSSPPHYFGVPLDRMRHYNIPPPYHQQPKIPPPQTFSSRLSVGLPPHSFRLLERHPISATRHNKSIYSTHSPNYAIENRHHTSHPYNKNRHSKQTVVNILGNKSPTSSSLSSSSLDAASSPSSSSTIAASPSPENTSPPPYFSASVISSSTTKSASSSMDIATEPLVQQSSLSPRAASHHFTSSSSRSSTPTEIQFGYRSANALKSNKYNDKNNNNSTDNAGNNNNNSNNVSKTSGQNTNSQRNLVKLPADSTKDNYCSTSERKMDNFTTSKSTPFPLPPLPRHYDAPTLRSNNSNLLQHLALGFKPLPHPPPLSASSPTSATVTSEVPENPSQHSKYPQINSSERKQKPQTIHTSSSTSPPSPLVTTSLPSSSSISSPSSSSSSSSSLSSSLSTKTSMFKPPPMSKHVSGPWAGHTPGTSDSTFNTFPRPNLFTPFISPEDQYRYLAMQSLQASSSASSSLALLSQASQLSSGSKVPSSSPSTAAPTSTAPSSSSLPSTSLPQPLPPHLPFAPSLQDPFGFDFKPPGTGVMPQSSPLASRNYLELAMLVCNTFRGKLFPCPHCRYVTDRRNNLKRHVATMHQACDKQLECCGVAFATKASLREHIAIFHHNGYSCTFCGRRFCRKALLKRHLSVHNGQKDYTCPHCDYATSHKSNLERHKRIHARLPENGESPMFPDSSMDDAIEDDDNNSMNMDDFNNRSAQSMMGHFMGNTNPSFNVHPYARMGLPFYYEHLHNSLLLPGSDVASRSFHTSDEISEKEIEMQRRHQAFLQNAFFYNRELVDVRTPDKTSNETGHKKGETGNDMFALNFSAIGKRGNRVEETSESHGSKERRQEEEREGEVEDGEIVSDVDLDDSDTDIDIDSLDETTNKNFDTFSASTTTTTTTSTTPSSNANNDDANAVSKHDNANLNDNIGGATVGFPNSHIKSTSRSNQNYSTSYLDYSSKVNDIGFSEPKGKTNSINNGNNINGNNSIGRDTILAKDEDKIVREVINNDEDDDDKTEDEDDTCSGNDQSATPGSTEDFDLSANTTSHRNNPVTTLYCSREIGSAASKDSENDNSTPLNLVKYRD